MAQDINHKHELKDKDSTLLEIIAHRCQGELRNAKGHSIKYLTERRNAALEILKERKASEIIADIANNETLSKVNEKRRHLNSIK